MRGDKRREALGANFGDSADKFVKEEKNRLEKRNKMVTAGEDN